MSGGDVAGVWDSEQMSESLVYAVPNLPVTLLDDSPALRAVVTREAECAGYSVDPDAEIRTRIVTSRFDPDMKMGVAEIDVR